MKNFPVLLLLVSAIAGAQTLRPIERPQSLTIPEPSDICVAPDGVVYIVSDQGYLFETDTEGRVVRKADYRGMDDEAVYADTQFVYVIEEAVRRVKIFDRASLELKRTVTLPYSGGRNKGYEALTYNPSTKKFLVFTEKDPNLVLEVDTDFHVTNEIRLDGLARDISAATFHDGFLWLLSDEDRTVFRVDASTYKPLEKWILPILNPEGIAFSPSGKLLILSDDMRRLYTFELPTHP